MWPVSRGGVLAVLFAALPPAFALTSLAARSYRDRESALAREWTDRGSRDLQAGRAADAVEDFRTASSFARRERSLGLRLADALIAAGRRPEARAQLLALRAEAPSDAVVNLSLARLAADAGNIAQASAYYHDAIAGVWLDTPDPEQRRRQARLEFAQVLLAHNGRTGAQAQLLALVAELPRQSDMLPRVAHLLRESGAPEKALDAYRELLDRDPRDAATLSGAGLAAFAMADYPTARQYLRAASRYGDIDAPSREALATATTLLELDPFLRRLSSGERTRRAFLSFRYARTRLADCTATIPADGDAAGALAELASAADRLEPSVKRPSFARDSDLLDEVMTLVFRIETTTAARCGEPAGPDRALLLMARQDRSADQ